MSHWYKKTGEPAYTQLKKDGTERATTLRDARKLDLVPSVTTLLQILAKPGLDNWKQQQVLLAALTMPKPHNVDEATYIKKIMADSREQAIKAAECGAAIHNAVEDAMQGKHISDEYKVIVDAVIDKLQQISAFDNEVRFATDKYGGKVDLVSLDKSIILDIKTKEFTQDNLPKQFDDHKLQLAGYAMGLGLPEAKTGNVFVSVSEPGLVYPVWTPEEEQARYQEMFNKIVDLWYLQRGL